MNIESINLLSMTENVGEFVNQNILITGATGKVGKATAMEIVKHNPKLLILTAKNSENLEKLKSDINSCYPNVSVLCCAKDMSRTEEIDQLFIYIDKVTQGKLNIFIGCHGITKNQGITIVNSDSETFLHNFNEIMNVNLHSYVYLTNLTTRIMKPNSSICFVTGILRKIHYSQGIALSTSKASLNMFVKCAALDLGPRKIRVNSVSPGLLDTKSLNINASKEEKEQILKNASQRFPLEHPILPIDIANSIIFLCSSKSSSITGQEIVVDSGQSLIPGNEE